VISAPVPGDLRLPAAIFTPPWQAVPALFELFRQRRFCPASSSSFRAVLDAPLE